MDKQLRAMGYSLESELIRDDFDGIEGDHTFWVTVSREGASYSTEYTAGCAHRHFRGGKAIEFTISRPTVDEVARRRKTLPNIPAIADVLACLVLDSQGVMDGKTFEEFADDLGYDTDSRKAERIFQACRNTYFGLVRIRADLDELGELFQDY